MAEKYTGSHPVTGGGRVWLLPCTSTSPSPGGRRLSYPPYSLEPTTFRFAALASLAGRSSLGGPREIALAIYVAARLADDAQPARAMTRELRADRAAHARFWLATLALPAGVRDAVSRLIDASAGDGRALAAATRAAAAAAAPQLDPAARLDLDRLAAALDAPVPVG
jgi:hypothetical protein